jgi:hypothetical protein
MPTPSSVEKKIPELKSTVTPAELGVRLSVIWTVMDNLHVSAPIAFLSLQQLLYFGRLIEDSKDVTGLPDILVKLLAVALANSAAAVRLLDPRAVLLITPASFTASVDDAKLVIAVGRSSDEAAALFGRFDTGLAEDPFAMKGCALDLIYAAFLAPDAFSRFDRNVFRE